MENWAEMNFLHVHNNVSRVERISYVYERYIILLVHFIHVMHSSPYKVIIPF
jgi:hypothetical protein